MADGESMKPGDFLIGVLDFFAILLPGVMATWLVLQYAPTPVLHRALILGFEEHGEPTEWVKAGAFLLASYVLGHFVFMLGARLDGSYDHWRKRTKPQTRDKTYNAARKLQEKLTEDLAGADWTTLKWAKAYIQVKAQHARAEIDRLEADQKFFRSLVVIAAAFAAHFFLREAAPLAGLIAVAAAIISYNRYVEQRWKMTELTYGTAVIVSKAGSPASAPAAGSAPD
jgi:hypothetical protein